MKIRGSLIANALLVIMFAGMLYISWDWPGKARDFPLLISVSGMFFSIWLVISGLIETSSSASQEKNKKNTLPSGTGVMIFWLALLFGVTIIFGFWVGSLIFMIAFMHFFGREGWKTTISITVVLVATLFIVLSVAMKISIYGGVLNLTPF